MSKNKTIQMVAGGSGYAAAARFAGVTQSTVMKWCKAAGVKSPVKPWDIKGKS